MHLVRYAKRPNVALLEQEIGARQLPGYLGLSWTGTELEISFQAEPTVTQRAELDAAVAAHDASVKTADQLAREAAATQEAADLLTLSTLLAKANSDITAGEVKTLLLTLLRRLQRQGRL